MKLAMAQMSMQNDMDANFKKTLSFIERAKGADLLFFPEIQLTPFFPLYHADELEARLSHRREDFLLEEEDWRLNRLIRAAREARLCLSPNVYMLHSGLPYDTSLLIDAEGRLLGRAAMVNVVSQPDFYETEYYTPSREGFRVFTLPFGRVGIVICYDRHLPSSVETCARMGAQLIIIPTANHTGEPMPRFAAEMQEQARHNRVYIAMCNRVGREGSVTFAGQSLVASPTGDLLCLADDRERLITIDIPL